MEEGRGGGLVMVEAERMRAVEEADRKRARAGQMRVEADQQSCFGSIVMFHDSDSPEGCSAAKRDNYYE